MEGRIGEGWLVWFGGGREGEGREEGGGRRKGEGEMVGDGWMDGGRD